MLLLLPLRTGRTSASRRGYHHEERMLSTAMRLVLVLLVAAAAEAAERKDELPSSTTSKPKSSDEQSAKGADDDQGGDVEVGSRRLGFGFGSGFGSGLLGFNNWQRPSPIAGPSASYPGQQDSFGSFGRPFGSQGPPAWGLWETTTRRPYRETTRYPAHHNPYDVTHRPPIGDFTTTRRPQFGQQHQGGGKHTTPRPSRPTASTSDDLFPNDICGPTGDDRIFGGNMSSVFELPWMARLGYTQTYSRRVSYRCGGALINSRYVLTAAHCVGDPDPDQVRLGELDEQSEIDCQEISGERVCAPKVVDVDIEKVIRHADFSSDATSPNYLKNDIALLRLKSPVTFTEAVKPICLPQGDAASFAGRNAMVAGWGRDKNDRSGGTRFLMKATVPVVDSAECARVYERRDIQLDSRSQMCAGGERGVDSCQGDSGGPLYRAGVVDGDPRTVQYGVVSFGLQRCGVEGVPGVYTRVQNFMPWIRANMKP